MQNNENNSSNFFDIVICGLGPVGLLACNTLGLRGYRVLGVDRFETAFNFPRAIHIDEEIVRIVQSVGLLDELMPRLKPSDGLEIVDKNFNVLFSAKTISESGFASSHFLFLQPELESILRKGCERFPNVTLMFGKDITDFRQEKERIIVFSKHEQIAKASYFIASDGAKSFTRNKLGIAINDLGFDTSNTR